MFTVPLLQHRMKILAFVCLVVVLGVAVEARDVLGVTNGRWDMISRCVWIRTCVTQQLVANTFANLMSNGLTMYIG